MSADSEVLFPPNQPADFESLCLDLWTEIWGPDSGAQKNGRSGQAIVREAVRALVGIAD